MSEQLKALQQIDPDLHIPGQGIGRTGMTVLLYGAMGTWKSTWAGCWPSPIVLSVGQEGGDDALAALPTLPPRPHPVPAVYQVQTWRDAVRKVDFIIANYERVGWKTVVIDSMTMLSDLWIADQLDLQVKRGILAPAMNMQLWGKLENDLIKGTAERLHGTRLNVIWLALEKQEFEISGQGGDRTLKESRPFIQGSAAIKLPAMCKVIIHAERITLPHPTDPKQRLIQPRYWTAPTLYTTRYVRHKYGPNAFPYGFLVDPEFGEVPTFEAFDSALGGLIYR